MMKHQKLLLLVAVLLTTPPIYYAYGECSCDVESEVQKHNRSESLKFKLVAIASMLVAGAIGVSLPLVGKKLEALRPENNIFFMIKAFAAGVILATGFVHVLPDAFETLTSPCLKDNPWANFPFTGFLAMMASIGTLVVDSLASGYYNRVHFEKLPKGNSAEVVDVIDEERAVDGGNNDEHAGHLYIHTHATHDHAHGSASAISSNEGHPHDHPVGLSQVLRQRIISQVLELGIVVHSVIIGLSLGASETPATIKPLIAALSFHQFFEGMGLGGCISQAKFKSLSTAMMAVFFSATAPVGIVIGIGISSVYHENSPKALIVAGILNSASAGILIYMALVDLLAADFMNPRLQNNAKLQLGANVSLLLGAGCMSVLAKWA